MLFGDYGDTSIALAIALANTRPVDGWPEELPDTGALAALLEDVGVAIERGPTEEDLREIWALREELATVLGAADTATAAAVLNDLIARVGAQPRLTDHDGEGWHLHYVPQEDRLATRLGAICASSLALVVRESGVSRLGACSDEGCDSFYVDASKNAARRFCSHRCATRSSVAAYRRRQRGASAE